MKHPSKAPCVVDVRLTNSSPYGMGWAIGALERDFFPPYEMRGGFFFKII